MGMMTANAQTYGDEGPTLTPNKFGLVYEDAINENVAGKIVPGATRIRTYFVKEYVNQITAKIQKFYTEKL